MYSNTYWVVWHTGLSQRDATQRDFFMYFQREQVISGHYGVFLSIALLHRGIKDPKKIGILINHYEI